MKLGLLSIMFLIFLTLKLIGAIAWSWWWVTAPIWGGAVVVILVVIWCALILSSRSAVLA